MRFAALVLSGVFMASMASAEEVKKVDIVDGAVEASLTGKPGDAVAGAGVFKGRKAGNCLACHANKDMSNEQFHGETGPIMDGVADRYSEAQLRAIVVNSKEVFGDHTLMPAFYEVDRLNRVAKKFEGKTVLSAQQVEDVVAYLLTLKE